jgi:hypothetical protein
MNKPVVDFGRQCQFENAERYRCSRLADSAIVVEEWITFRCPVHRGMRTPTSRAKYVLVALPTETGIPELGHPTR